MATQLRILTADEIYAADDIEERVVPVPQWGRDAGVRIRALSQKQAGELRKRASRTNMVTKQVEIDNDTLEALLFVEGVVEPKFTLTDYARLQDKSMAAMGLIQREILDISGMSEAAVKEATKSPAEGLDAEV